MTPLLFINFARGNYMELLTANAANKKIALSVFVAMALMACEPKADESADTKAPPVAEVASAQSAQAQSAPAQAQPPQSAGEIHAAAVTIDTHIDIPLSLGTEAADFRSDGPMQVDLPKMRAGGLDAGFFIVYVGQGPLNEAGYQEAYAEAQRKFEAIERMVSNSPDDIALVTSPAQLKAALAQGKLAAAIGVENAYPLGPDYQHLQEFYDRGARYISLTHFGHNHFGDSSAAKGEQGGVAEPVSHGLSEKGLALIDQMNRLGIMVDVSHTSKESTLAAVERSKAPVIASHSGVKALYDHPRNLSDEEIKAIAAKGGVMQIVAFDSYMRDVSDDNKAAVAAIREEMGLTAADWYKTASQATIGGFRKAVAALNSQFPRASVADLVDGIDYVVKLVGIDYVGIASDFGGGGGVQGWDSIDQSQAITEELVNRGYTYPQIEQIWGGNLLRVWQQVEDSAQTAL
ncbi:pyoverdine-tailoring dipeptidase-like protein PvdM [Halioxenophilus aromaticivorans]|uniref:Pyoverdine-tailoring dipeptidase-like protein PvdM n=2 Tax=Halioxenophilus aromaticivorans TaxID=1306992 RepID=A0AAV3U293_9ALTE